MSESHPQASARRRTRVRKAPVRNVAPPTQVTLIGHNSQIVATAGFFVGAEVTVQVYTSRPGVELDLAPYPGVQVTLITDDYAACPLGLPPPPYLVAVDDDATAARIRTWLPPTCAVFLVRGPARRAARSPEGFLTLLPPSTAARAPVFTRLATLDRLDRLLAPARLVDDALILMYGDPDPDAIGAALGLATLWRSVGCDARIRFTGDVHRYQNRLLIKWLRKKVEQLEDGELAKASLVAVVDAQPGFWKHDPPHAHVVIDHHPVREDTVADFTDLRPHYGATSSMVTEYLLEAELTIDRQLATALLFGITTDTNDLKRKTTAADIAAFEVLHEKADRYFLERLEKSQIPASMLDVIAWGITHRVVYRDHMLIHFGQVRSPDHLVQVADLLLLTYGISWVVCAGVVGKPRRLVAIFRGDGHHQDVGRRAALAFADLGSAGGHRTMGRAEVALSEEQTLDDTCALLVNCLFKRMRPARARSFIRTLRKHLDDARPAVPDEYEL